MYFLYLRSTANHECEEVDLIRFYNHSLTPELMEKVKKFSLQTKDSKEIQDLIKKNYNEDHSIDIIKQAIIMLNEPA